MAKTGLKILASLRLSPLALIPARQNAKGIRRKDAKRRRTQLFSETPASLRLSPFALIPARQNAKGIRRKGARKREIPLPLLCVFASFALCV
ncbi:MAG: hypothetical protein WCT12_35430, partial [Verrucomicrobiota bacterium]